MIFYELVNKGYSQNINLVPNGGFEYYTNCPTNNKSNNLKGWFTVGTKNIDYFNECGKNGFDIKNNIKPKNGKGYVGISVLDKNKKINRSLLQIELEQKLKKHHKYYLEFYINLSENSNFFSENFGIAVTSMKLPSVKEMYMRLSLILPTVSVNKKDSILEDKDGWIKISGTFISYGTEKYLSIGSFFYDLFDEKSLFDKKISLKQNQNTCYYYIDDVKLYEIKDVIKENSNLIINGNFEDLYTCPKTNVSNFHTVYGWNEVDTIIDGVIVFNNSVDNQYQAATPIDVWGSPDLYASCNRDTISSVHNKPIGVSNSNTGNFVGINLFGFSGNQKQRGREYLITKLKNPLQENVKYKLKLSIRLSYLSKYSSNSFGALFTEHRVFHMLEDINPIKINPQIEFNSKQISNKDEWIIIEDIFIAKGGEHFMTLGDFNKSGTNFEYKLQDGKGLDNTCYYLIDNVTLIQIE